MAVNTFLGFVHTARHMLGAVLSRRQVVNLDCSAFEEANVNGWVGDYYEVVTRYSYWEV